jgi:hypothetical protein
MNDLPPINDEERSRLPRYSLKTLLTIVALLALAFILLLKFLQYHREADIRDAFGGTVGLSVLKHPDRIDAFRIDKPKDRRIWSTAGLADYPILNGPIVVSPPVAQQLIDTLQNRNSYLWNVRKACIPLPGVRLDFVRGSDRLSVLLCFECDMVENFLNGKLVGGANTDNARSPLVREVKRLFPNDPIIRSLTEQP